MKTLFIPEIGTEITLAEDWFFPLYVERRNELFAKKLGYPHSNHWYGREWISQELYDLYDTIYKEYKNKHNAELGADFCSKHFMDYHIRPEWVKLNDEYHKNHNEAHKQYENTEHIYKEFVNVILSKETILKIDRIYIRKGKGMSDFSSLTFYIKNGVYKGARF